MDTQDSPAQGAELAAAQDRLRKAQAAVSAALPAPSATGKTPEQAAAFKAALAELTAATAALKALQANTSPDDSAVQALHGALRKQLDS